MNKFLGILFAISCFATSWISGGLLGVGMWFWIIIVTGTIVAATQFVPSLRLLGSLGALLLGVVSVLAVALTLFAATIGGSFKLDTNEFLLVLGFVMIAIFGFSLVRINRRIAE